MNPRLLAIAVLACSALLMICVYALLLVMPYPLLRWYDVPLLDLGKLAGFGVLHALALAGAFVLVFGSYLAAWRAAARLGGRSAVVAVLGTGILLSLLLIWVYPVGANDIYDYIFRARLWGLYDYNPLTVTPLRVNEDPWFPYVVWVWFTSPYGPLWAEMSVVVYRLSGGSLLMNLLLFKLLAILCTAGISVLLYDLLRERGEGAALGGVLLFAWNPLVLFETAVNGHNDVVMMLLVVGALWLYRRGWLWAALGLGTLAALVKVAALLALAILLAAVARSVRLRAGSRNIRAVAVGIGCCVLTGAVVYAPLWQGSQTFAGLLALDNRFTASPAAIVKLALEISIGREWAEWLARTIFMALFPGTILILLRRVERGSEPVTQMLISANGLLLTLGTLWFQPWYLVWLLALAPLAGERGQTAAVLGSAGALGLYLLFDFGWYWLPDFFNGANGLVLNLTAVALWMGPPTLWLGTQRLRKARSGGEPVIAR